MSALTPAIRAVHIIFSVSVLALEQRPHKHLQRLGQVTAPLKARLGLARGCHHEHGRPGGGALGDCFSHLASWVLSEDHRAASSGILKHKNCMWDF